MANQVDVVQASIIALEIFQAFRFVYPGLDLMPDIFIQKNSSFGFVKYDFLCKEVILPLFSEALSKHNLDTDLVAEPLEIKLPESSILQKGDVNIVIRAFRNDIKDMLSKAYSTSLELNEESSF